MSGILPGRLRRHLFLGRLLFLPWGGRVQEVFHRPLVAGLPLRVPLRVAPVAQPVVGGRLFHLRVVALRTDLRLRVRVRTPRSPLWSDLRVTPEGGRGSPPQSPVKCVDGRRPRSGMGRGSGTPDWYLSRPERWRDIRGVGSRREGSDGPVGTRGSTSCSQ